MACKGCAVFFESCAEASPLTDQGPYPLLVVFRVLSNWAGVMTGLCRLWGMVTRLLTGSYHLQPSNKLHFTLPSRMPSSTTSAGWY